MEPTYSVVLTSHDLRIDRGETTGAILSLRGGQNPQIRYADGEWSVVSEYKKNDYEYGFGLAPKGKWVSIDSLPSTLLKLSLDRRQIAEKGPAFQIVKLGP
jgi:hypothetical protein